MQVEIMFCWRFFKGSPLGILSAFGSNYESIGPGLGHHLSITLTPQSTGLYL